jgi:hypothetical protein
VTGPTRRERLRPLELVGMGGGLGLFTGVIAFLGTREIQLALIFAGVAFIAGLLVLAMLALAAGPEQEGDIDRPVLEQRDEERSKEGDAGAS